MPTSFPESCASPGCPDGTTDRTTDETTGGTTSHLTRLSKNDIQVIGYSHSAMPPQNGGQAAGYSHLTATTTGETTSHPTKQPEDGCQVFGYSHSTRLSAEELVAGHPKNDNQVVGYNPAKSFA